MAIAELNTDRLEDLLGDDAEMLLSHTCEGISQDLLHLPGPDFIDRVVAQTDRNPQVLRNLSTLFNSGRLAGSGYVSILPVDQGLEHSGAASFAPNPIYFDPARLAELAIEGGCNAFASSVGVLGSISRSHAHKIPFIVKLNHNELLTYPNTYDQVAFTSPRRAWELGAAGVGATIYFGSEQSRRQIVEIAEAFQEAHELGMFTVLWCYLRSDGFKVNGTDYHTAADLTGQANHIGVTIEADIIKQKLPEVNGGFLALNEGGSVVRQDLQARLRRAHHGQPDRLDPLAARQLLQRPRAADQLRRRLLRGDGSVRGGQDRGRQQARRRHRPDLRPQGLPAADGRGRFAPARHPGRLPQRGRQHRVGTVVRGPEAGRTVWAT